MTAIQERSLVSLRYGGVFARRWDLVSRRQQTWRTRVDTVFCLVAICLFLVLSKPSADASPVRREGPQPLATAGVTSSATAPKPHPGEDIPSKVNSADIVFEGKARSRSPQLCGFLNVTFAVKHIYKGAQTDLKTPQVRLQFFDKNTKVTERECFKIIERVGYVVKANIKRGKRYIVFLDKAGTQMFKPNGEPVVRNKENVQAVKNAVCGAPLRLSGLKDQTLKPKEKLTLTCRLPKGITQQPQLQWYKNGVKINTAKERRIRLRKKKLIIAKVTTEDSGEYECRTVSTQCPSASARAKINVKAEKENATTPGPPLYNGAPCPFEAYCLNGGTCSWYETIAEMACQCAEGYKGQRCDLKDVHNTASMYRHMSYFCKLGLYNSYYC